MGIGALVCFLVSFGLLCLYFRLHGVARYGVLLVVGIFLSLFLVTGHSLAGQAFA